ncbi:MAG TPA: hypothetical protein PLS46_16565, partial [Microthrixaceae bacterium]|nr:hypothetical protein [Microthrixaceae bacterium]
MQRRIRLIGAVAVAALTAFTACTPPPQPRPPLPTPYTGGTNPDLAPQAGDAAYVEPGPYVAGVTTVEIEP